MIEFKGKIPDDIVEIIKGEVRAEDIASLLSPKHKTGRYQYYACPQCSGDDAVLYDKSPKYRTNVYCYNCHKSFTPVDVVAMKMNLDFHDAMLWLADVRNGRGKVELMNLNAGTSDMAQKEESQTAPVNPPVEPVTSSNDAVAETYIDIEKIESCVNDFEKTNLYRYFVEALKLDVSRVDAVARLYGVGGIAAPKQGWSDKFPVVFPYADADANICFGRISAYNRDGHRVKFRNSKGEPIALMTNFSTDASATFKPLFGSHLALLPEEGDKAAVVVESEKTCMLMRMLAPQFVWLASCSMNWITRQNAVEKLMPFRNRPIYLLPDRNAVSPAKGNWDDIAAALREQGYNAKCLSGFMRYYFSPRDSDSEDVRLSKFKADVGDAVEDALLSEFWIGMKRSMIKVLLRDMKEAMDLPFDEDYLSFKAKQYEHTK